METEDTWSEVVVQHFVITGFLGELTCVFVQYTPPKPGRSDWKAPKKHDMISSIPPPSPSSSRASLGSLGRQSGASYAAAGMLISNALFKNFVRIFSTKQDD